MKKYRFCLASTLALGLCLVGCGGHGSVTTDGTPSSSSVKSIFLQDMAALKPMWAATGFTFGAGSNIKMSAASIAAGGVKGKRASAPSGSPASGYNDSLALWYSGTLNDNGTFSYLLYTDAAMTQYVGTETYTSGSVGAPGTYPMEDTYDLNITGGSNPQEIYNDVVDPDGSGENVTITWRNQDSAGNIYTVVDNVTNSVDHWTTTTTIVVEAPKPALIFKATGTSSATGKKIAWSGNNGTSGTFDVAVDMSGSGVMLDRSGHLALKVSWNSAGKGQLVIGSSAEPFDMAAALPKTMPNAKTAARLPQRK